REQLHRLIVGLLGHGQEVLGRWAGVMVNSGTYAEIVDRHVELYSRLYWWGSVLDEPEPLEEHLSRPRLSRVSPATQAVGPVEAASGTPRGVWLHVGSILARIGGYPWMRG